MGTPFTSIYQRALSRFMDYDFLRLDDNVKRQILHGHMLCAEKDFAPHCLVSLERDEKIDEYVEDLGDEIEDIIACGISYYWLSSKVMNSEHLRNKMSSKDISYFSPANLLREMTALRTEVGKEFRDKIVRYTYDHGDIAGLKVGD